jgi:hypothetical protein
MDYNILTEAAGRSRNRVFVAKDVLEIVELRDRKIRPPKPLSNGVSRTLK